MSISGGGTSSFPFDTSRFKDALSLYWHPVPRSEKLEWYCEPRENRLASSFTPPNFGPFPHNGNIRPYPIPVTPIAPDSTGISISHHSVFHQPRFLRKHLMTPSPPREHAFPLFDSVDGIVYHGVNNTPFQIFTALCFIFDREGKIRDSFKESETALIQEHMRTSRNSLMTLILDGFSSASLLATLALRTAVVRLLADLKFDFVPNTADLFMMVGVVPENLAQAQNMYEGFFPWSPDIGGIKDPLCTFCPYFALFSVMDRYRLLFQDIHVPLAQLKPLLRLLLELLVLTSAYPDREEWTDLNVLLASIGYALLMKYSLFHGSPLLDDFPPDFSIWTGADAFPSAISYADVLDTWEDPAKISPFCFCTQIPDLVERFPLCTPSSIGGFLDIFRFGWEKDILFLDKPLSAVFDVDFSGHLSVSRDDQVISEESEVHLGRQNYPIVFLDFDGSLNYSDFVFPQVFSPEFVQAMGDFFYKDPQILYFAIYLPTEAKQDFEPLFKTLDK